MIFYEVNMKAFVPELVNLPDSKVFTITTKGDPNKIGEATFSALYGTAYSTKFKTFKPKGVKMPLGKLCALWPDAHTKPKNEWMGVWAIPVPDFVTEGDVIQKDPENKVALKKWDGGKYAQILHKGSYDEEGPTVEKLRAFIEGQGIKFTEVLGTHEEEYCKIFY